VSNGDRRFVYVLRSLVDPTRHYVGLTSDVALRLVAHNAGQSHHGAKYRPWTLVVPVEFAAEEEAARFEKYLKSGSGRAFAKRHFA
jgi:putative endonuclease